MMRFRREPADVLGELAELRAGDAPTHGGRVLSYVYDSGVPELDELAADAARLVQPVNGLDPTTFGSVAAMEAGVVGFARRIFHGADSSAGAVCPRVRRTRHRGRSSPPAGSSRFRRR